MTVGIHHVAYRRGQIFGQFFQIKPLCLFELVGFLRFELSFPTLRFTIEYNTVLFAIDLMQQVRQLQVFLPQDNPSFFKALPYQRLPGKLPGFYGAANKGVVPTVGLRLLQEQNAATMVQN